MIDGDEKIGFVCVKKRLLESTETGRLNQCP